jgi:hypothetical protein
VDVVSQSVQSFGRRKIWYGRKGGKEGGGRDESNMIWLLPTRRREGTIIGRTGMMIVIDYVPVVDFFISFSFLCDK